MAQPVIRFETVSKLYGGQPVLHRLELEVQQGEFLTLIGRSGCGKTTALKLINGLIAPDEGRVLVRGRTWPRPTRSRCAGRSATPSRGWGFSPT